MNFKKNNSVLQSCSTIIGIAAVVGLQSTKFYLGLKVETQFDKLHERNVFANTILVLPMPSPSFCPWPSSHDLKVSEEISTDDRDLYMLC